MPMSKSSFDNKSSVDKLKRLLKQYEEFKLDKTSTDKAEDLSTTAWHLTDWVFSEYGSTRGYDDLGDFRATLYPECASLKIMHDLATSAKHAEVTKPKAFIKEAITKPGPFSGVFSSEFVQTTLQIELEDGTILYFGEEIKKVVNFWKAYFVEKLNIQI